jgi:hypothetical protein
MKLALLLIAAVAVTAQTGTVEGRVVNGASGEPVRRASVSVRRPGQVFTVESNSNGAFRVDGLAAGEYTMSVLRTGYVPSGGRDFEIGANARMSGIVVSLTPMGVIAGRVLDPEGDPISGATVHAMQYTYTNGKRQLRVARTTTSDDRGQYRLFDLSPGRYYVQGNYARGTTPAALDLARVQFVSAPPGGQFTAYYPASADVSGAAAVDATAGGEMRGIDVRLRTSGAYTVRVRVPNVPEIDFRPGPERAMLMATLTPRGAPQATGVRTSGFRQRGNILEATEVPPGVYTFTARQIGVRDPNAPPLSAKRVFEVAGADVELEVMLTPPLDISGALVGLTDASKLYLRLDSIDDNDPFTRVSAKAEPDGSFVLKSVTADSYFVRVAAPEGFYVHSVRFGDRQVDSQKVEIRAAASPLMLLLADDGAEIAGLVLDGQERPMSNATVALEPLAADWPDRMKTLTADPNGNFRFHDVAPGQYRVLAWKGQEPDESAAVKVRATADGEHRITVRVR